MFKKPRLLAGLLSLTLLLTACGGGAANNGAGENTGNSAATEADAEGKTKIVFWHGMGGSTGEALDKLVDQYNQSQDAVVVESSYQGAYDETLTKLRSSASGEGVGADLVQIFDLGTTFMSESGLIEPMQTYVDKDGYDISVLEPNVLAYYTINGSLNSMPFNSSTPILYYNKDMFEAAGIEEVPTNLEEIIALKDDITSKTDAKFPISIDIYGWYMEQWFSKQEEHIFDQGNGREGAPTKVAFDENGCMEDIITTWKKGIDEEAIANPGREGSQGQFVAGEAAMTLASTANLRQMLDEVGGRFEVGTAYYPAVNPEGKGGVSIGGASLWMIDSGDEARKDATWDFVKFLMSPEVQAQWNADTGYFPVNTEAQETETFKKNIEEFPQFQTALDQLHDSSPESQGALSGVNQEARQIYEAAVESFFGGATDAKEAVEAMASQVNSALDIYNEANQ
ncbi:MAG: ABC transporter substrate-binding protein [Tissierellia bacterium]|nr:ABC transporter substrate-binding protein [Tissierellia bacterium]